MAFCLVGFQVPTLQPGKTWGSSLRTPERSGAMMYALPVPHSNPLPCLSAERHRACRMWCLCSTGLHVVNEGLGDVLVVWGAAIIPRVATTQTAAARAEPMVLHSALGTCDGGTYCQGNSRKDQSIRQTRLAPRHGLSAPTVKQSHTGSGTIGISTRGRAERIGL